MMTEQIQMMKQQMKKPLYLMHFGQPRGGRRR